MGRPLPARATWSFVPAAFIVDSVQSTPAIRVPSLLKEWLQRRLAESNERRRCFRLAKALPALEFPQFPLVLWQLRERSRLPFDDRPDFLRRRLQPGDIGRLGSENRVMFGGHDVLLAGQGRHK